MNIITVRTATQPLYASLPRVIDQIWNSDRPQMKWNAIWKLKNDNSIQELSRTLRGRIKVFPHFQSCYTWKFKLKFENFKLNNTAIKQIRVENEEFELSE